MSLIGKCPLLRGTDSESIGKLSFRARYLVLYLEVFVLYP